MSKDKSQHKAGRRNKQNRRMRLLEQRRIAQAAVQATTFINEDNEGMHRLPVVWANNDSYLTEDDIWTGFHIPGKRDGGFLSERQRQEHFLGALGAIRDFPADKENEGHILVLNQSRTSAEWQRELLAKTRRKAAEEGREIEPFFRQYIDHTRRQMEAREFFDRETYLFVKVGERENKIKGVRSVLNAFTRSFTSRYGLDDSQPEDDEKQSVTKRSQQLQTRLGRGWFAAEPLRRSRLEWVIRYCDSVGLPTPSLTPMRDEDNVEWGIGRWRTTMAAWTKPVDLGITTNGDRVRGIQLVGPTGEGQSYVTFLPLSSIPSRMSPTLNWLHYASALSFPVDVSIHFEVIDPLRAERELERPLDAAKAQQLEEQDADRAPDDVVTTQREELERVRQNTILGKNPLAFWQCVFAIYDTDPDALLRKVAELQTLYQEIQFKLETPPDDQRELFYQQFPGSTITVKDWIQRTNVDYLASSSPWLTSNVGTPYESASMYQGYTVLNGKQGSPVFEDLADIVDESGRAPVAFVGGAPGSGKTVSLGLKPVWENAMRGLTQFVWDPKNDFAPFYLNAKSLRLNPSKVRYIDLDDPSASISLDAFACAEYSKDEKTGVIIDDRQTLATDILKELAAGPLSEDRTGTLGLVLQDVVTRVMENAEANGTDPKMSDIFGVLDDWEVGTAIEHIPVTLRDGFSLSARRLNGHLKTIAKDSAGRMLFLDPSQGRLGIEVGTTTIFIAVRLAEAVDKDGIAATISKAIQGMMASYIRSLLFRLPSEASKVVVFDEWHVISQLPQAQRLLDWLRRMGRSKRCQVTFLSQEPKEGFGGTLNSIWIGYCNHEGAARDACELLGIEPSESNKSVFMNLKPGCFVHRDSLGRVSRVNVDIWDQGVLDIFNTQAADKAAKKAAERANSQPVTTAD